MTRDNPVWVAVGSEVFCGDRLTKIAKIYKSGNFVLEGGTQQFRAFGDSAHSTGGFHYGRAIVVPATPANRAKRREAEAVRVAKAALYDQAERLQRIARSGDPAAILAAAAALTPDPETAT